MLVLFVAACYSAAGALWLQLGGLPLICDGHGEARWVALGAVKPWAKRNGTAHLPRVPPPALPL